MAQRFSDAKAPTVSTNGKSTASAPQGTGFSRWCRAVANSVRAP